MPERKLASAFDKLAELLTPEFNNIHTCGLTYLVEESAV